jgi:hypothetical protein
MSNQQASRRPLLLGLALLLTAAAVNQWSLAWALSADELIEGPKALAMIWGFQGFLALVGLTVLARNASTLLTGGAAKALSAALLLVTLVGLFGTLKMHGYFKSSEERERARLTQRMVNSETLHLNLGGRAKKLTKALKNLRIPSGEAEKVLGDTLRVRDLDPTGHTHVELELPTVATVEHGWDLADLREVGRDEFSFLAPFLDQMEYIDSGKIGFIGGDFAAEDFSVWRVRSYVKAIGKGKNGQRVKGKGHLVLQWSIKEGHDPSDPDDFQDYDAWYLTGIELEEFHTFEAPFTFYEEVLGESLADADTLEAARRNIAQEQIVERLRVEGEGGEWEEPHEFWGHMASWRHPSVSVVDVDQDGFDDIYSMARYGKNLFLRNNGDGTFEERAADLGLDFEDHTAMALFADFDNDGDDDAFIGRTLARSLLLENDGTRFVDRSADWLGEELPYFAVTASAADVDNDGLLDLYVGTYGAQLIGKDLRRKGGMKAAGGMVLDDYLPEHRARTLFDAHFGVQENRIRDRVGPPNLLLRNMGGRFEVDEDSPLTLYRNTFQSTFADYDDDGDVDVYVANDFAPNYMFRNDGGVFTDVTEESQAADIGFGMGISWGDYDKDGDQDAYVSNMYSKAGNRILGMVTTVDRVFMQMAAGNSLLELQDGRFDRVSSVSGPGMHVEYGGWSWGSVWVDVDNDSWLDLYALSGHYTAPKEIRNGHDL